MMGALKDKEWNTTAVTAKMPLQESNIFYSQPKDNPSTWMGPRHFRQGNDMQENVISIEAKVDRLIERQDNLGAAFKGFRQETGDNFKELRADMANSRTDLAIFKRETEVQFTGIKKDIWWIKWIMGTGIAAIVSVGIYFASRQNALSDQITELIKTLAR